MTHEEMEAALKNHAAWIIHMRDTLDEATLLIQAMARQGENADKRIAELAVAQQKTEKLLQTFINSRLTNGHGNTDV